MSPDPVVSVIIPAYNAEGTLATTLRSVLEQPLAEVEVLVVDDASTDGTVVLARSLAEGDLRVRVERLAHNGGPARARNHGLSLARAPMVCFLDADDLQDPAFLSETVAALGQHPDWAAIQTGVEIVGLDRPIHPVQLWMIEGALPCNFVIRREVMQLMGGFPEHPVFRGRYAGEDSAVRRALRLFFKIGRHPRPLYRFTHRPGGHLERFLERTEVRDGRVSFLSAAPEEADGTLADAIHAYVESVERRLVSLHHTVQPVAVITAQRFEQTFPSWLVCHGLTPDIDRIPGDLQPEEGWALYHWARYGPGVGGMVALGADLGRSSIWLAAGTRDGGRAPVTAVAPFLDLSEQGDLGSLLPEFNRNLESMGLGSWVRPLVGEVSEVASRWSGPVRLLFIDTDHAYEVTRRAFLDWFRFVEPGGIVAFHGVGVDPGVTAFFEELRVLNPDWLEVAAVARLRLLVKPKMR